MQRLKHDLSALMADAPPGVSAFPLDNDVFLWTATVMGVAGTVYDGMRFTLELQFPDVYPLQPPIVTFTPSCFHPNVDAQDGRICLNILNEGEGWSPSFDVGTVLLSIQSLLGDPNTDSPLNVPAAALWGRPAYVAAMKAHDAKVRGGTSGN